MSRGLDVQNQLTMTDRHWDSELQQWVHAEDVSKALDAALLATEEFYNGDRAWAERWLIRAYEANQKGSVE